MSGSERLTDEEFAALLALDGSWNQQRQPPHVELQLRKLGLIEPSPFSRLPIRTAAGEALVRSASQQHLLAAD